MPDWTPRLVVISGPSGAGKTTLAHALARHMGCPAICRDEIKEGMTLAAHGSDASDASERELTHRTFPLFFDVVGRLLAEGTTVVAEAAFQDFRWRPQLERLQSFASIRVIRCRVSEDTSLSRIADRLDADHRRTSHTDQALLAQRAGGQNTVDSFVWISLDVPTLDVDTTDGYQPGLDAIAAFVTN